MMDGCLGYDAPIMLALLLLENLPAVSPDMVISGGIAGLVLWFWRQDRKDRAEEKTISEKRYADLALDFRKLVQDNTAAIVALREAIRGTKQCPLYADGRLDKLENHMSEMKDYTHKRIHEIAGKAQIKLSKMELAEDTTESPDSE